MPDLNDIPVEYDTQQHELEISKIPQDRSVELWQRWKESPSPQSMAMVVNSVRPVIDKSVSRFPNYNPAVLGGEAKRLTISAIKTYDPERGTSLNTHVYSHLKAMNRHTQGLTSSVGKSRLETQRTAKYLGAVKDLSEMNNREPSDSEVQDFLGVNNKEIKKMRLASRGEFSEGQVEFLPGQREDPRVSMWTDYIYNDQDATGKLIMDYKMGRNGRQQMTTEQTAKILGLNPDYVNRKAGTIANKILSGVNHKGKADDTNYNEDSDNSFSELDNDDESEDY